MNKYTNLNFIAILTVICVFSIFNAGFAEEVKKNAKINGFDSTSKKTLESVVLFNDFSDMTRGRAGSVSHGEIVTVLEKSGAGVKIKTSFLI